MKVKLGSIAKIRRGASPRPIDNPLFWGGTVGWIRIVDVTGSNKYLLKTEQYVTKLGESKSLRLNPGDFILSICATVGIPAILKIPACIHDGFVNIYELKGVEKEYLYYYFTFSRNEIIGMAQPGTQINLNTKLIANHYIFLPSLSQQKKIAKILSTVDAQIEATEELIAKYEKVKEGLMHDLFTRGIDPKTGKLRPSVDDAPELYKKSVLGWIPMEWEVKELGEVCERIQDGTHFSPSISPNGTFKYITSKNIRFGHLDLNNCDYVVKEEHEKIYRHCPVKFGDVLLTKDGANTGNVTLNPLREPFSLLSSVAFIRGKKELINNDYICQWIMSKQGQSKLKDSMSGLAIPRVTLTIINSYLIPLSSKEEQLLIQNKLGILDLLNKNETTKLQKLHSLKKALMQDLLTGKVPVTP